MKFTINKGSHYSDKWFYKLCHFFVPKKKKGTRALVCFNDDCAYRRPRHNSDQINKLFGMSDGWHHTNSARFGWNVGESKFGRVVINIFAYLYIDGKRFSIQITQVRIGEYHDLRIEFVDRKWVFRVDDENFKVSEFSIFHTNLGKRRFSYRLWPYYGGESPAPDMVKIDLNFRTRFE